MEREECISFIDKLNKKYHVEGQIPTSVVLEEAAKLASEKRPDEDDRMFKAFLWCAYRKKLAELSAITINPSSLLEKYIDVHSMKIYDVALKDDMNAFLSFMNREQFDYYMARYFLLDETVVDDPALEKEIGTIFNCKGPIGIYASMKRIRPYNASEISLLKYSDYISPWFLFQVSRKGRIIQYPDVHEKAFTQNLQNTRVNGLKYLVILWIVLSVISAIIILTPQLDEVLWYKIFGVSG